MRVRFSADAEADIAAVEDYMRANNPGNALIFIRELAKAAIAIGSNPFAHALLHAARAAGLRRKVHKRYLIIYRVGEQVEIVRIIHGSRDIDRILFSDLP